MAIKKEYWLFGGMGGGFGGPNYLGSAECFDAEEASREAYALAVEDYESYAGNHGVQSRDEVYEELEPEFDTIDEREIEQMVDEAYAEAIESWISYWAVEAIPGVDPEEWLEDWRCQHGD